MSATSNPAPDRLTLETLDEIESLLEASERHIKKLPWRVIPSDGKPIVAGQAHSGNIFRGYIATWEEADLTVAAINALPALIAGYRQLLAEGDGETDGWITIQAERVLYIDEGKERVACDRLPSPVTLIIKAATPKGGEDV